MDVAKSTNWCIIYVCYMYQIWNKAFPFWGRNQFLALSPGFSCFCDELKALSVSLCCCCCWGIASLSIHLISFLESRCCAMTLSFCWVDAVLEALRQSLIVTTVHMHTALTESSAVVRLDSHKVSRVQLTTGRPINETGKKKIIKELSS